MIPVRYALILGLASLLAMPSLSRADEWNERTILTFSSPVMIPGATLQPGTYVFQLASPGSASHTVRITRQDSSDVIATLTAVPVKRAEASSDNVLRFSPTDTGYPPALKAWFYPGSTYGHQFVYPEEQARQIAAREKTLVLSIDIPNSDREKGVLRTLDPAGRPAEWRADADTMREWETWRKTREMTDDELEERKAGTAAMVRGNFTGTRVKLDDLESNPRKYFGQTISVDAEVEEVFGPRLFTIDEPHWGDLDGEILVYMPTNLAALVSDNDRITITGVVKPFVRTEVEREWGWFGLDPAIEVEVGKKPVLVANHIVGGNDKSVMVIDINSPNRLVGALTGSPSPMTDAGAIATASNALVGRRVMLNRLRIVGTADGGGFFVESGGRELFVLPARSDQVSAQVGDNVTVEGVILEMPSGMAARIKAPTGANQDLYIYATKITK